MNNPTASKQYVLPIQFTSGDVQTLTLNTTLGGFGASTITYNKVGNLYFGFTALTFGGLDILFGSGATGQHTIPGAQASADEIASLLGVTINTYYIRDNYGAYTGYYFGGTWVAEPPANNVRYIVLGFLAN